MFGRHRQPITSVALARPVEPPSSDPAEPTRPDARALSDPAPAVARRPAWVRRLDDHIIVAPEWASTQVRRPVG